MKFHMSIIDAFILMRARVLSQGSETASQEGASSVHIKERILIDLLPVAHTSKDITQTHK